MCSGNVSAACLCESLPKDARRWEKDGLLRRVVTSLQASAVPSAAERPHSSFLMLRRSNIPSRTWAWPCWPQIKAELWVILWRCPEEAPPPLKFQLFCFGLEESDQVRLRIRITKRQPERLIIILICFYFGSLFSQKLWRMKSESEKYQQRFFSPKHAVILAFSKETAGGLWLSSQCVQSAAEMCFLSLQSWWISVCCSWAQLWGRCR